MNINLQQIANEITRNDAKYAAATTARLLKFILDALPSQKYYADFVAALKAQMAAQGYRFEYMPSLMPFYKLGVGEFFKTSDGALYRKIEPVSTYDFRDQMTFTHPAARRMDNQQVKIFGANDIVERVSAPAIELAEESRK
ncbi:MAG: hypothetical protein HY741_22905 [Chloroflexi bacterium]|nr:hypothetical protein [Chloroflexota bacterium]